MECMDKRNERGRAWSPWSGGVGAAYKPVAATQEPIAGAILQDRGRVSCRGRAHAKRSASDKASAIGPTSMLGSVIDLIANESALPICDSNSMNELSCRESAPNTLGQIPLVVTSVVFLLSSVQQSVLARSEVQNIIRTIHLVDLRPPSLQDLAWRVLQLIRSSAHLLAQQLFPRTHVQLQESFTCQIRVVSVELRVILALAQEANGSVPYDQLYAAHPHVNNIMYTMRIRCDDGCIANMCKPPNQPITTNHYMSATTSIAEFCKIGRNTIRWSTESSC